MNRTLERDEVASRLHQVYRSLKMYIDDLTYNQFQAYYQKERQPRQRHILLCFHFIIQKIFTKDL